MQIRITNFRGIKRAEMDLSALCLVSGNNASGKSSIAHAVQAALSGNPVPLEGMRKTDAGMLVHAGTGKGEIVVETPDGTITVTYPKAAVKTEGTPPAASLFALGAKSLLDMAQKDASATLIEYLKALPTEADVHTAAKGAGLDSAQRDRLWQKILDLGWDGTHVAAKETGIKLKGQWESTAGERYGSAKAESWMPADWETDLDGGSEDTLQAQVTEAREFLETAIAANAVSADERARLEADASTVDDRRAAVTAAESAAKAAEDAADAARKTLADAEAKRKALPPTKDEPTQDCPHCGKPIAVDHVWNGPIVLKKPEAVDGAALKKRQMDIASWDGKVGHAREAMNAATRALSAAQGDVATAKVALADAEKAVAKLNGTPAGDGDAAAVEQARENAARAERRLLAFQRKRKADSLHASITINQQVVAMLAPDGLRLRKLQSAVRNFNKQLSALSETAGWGTVVLEDDLVVSYDGKPSILLAESERFRARVTLQVAMCDLDRSAACVIDAADILDRNGRNGLLRLLGHLGKPALVCMTLQQNAVPNLADAGTGTSYWLEGGVAKQASAAAA